MAAEPKKMSIPHTTVRCAVQFEDGSPIMAKGFYHMTIAPTGELKEDGVLEAGIKKLHTALKGRRFIATATDYTPENQGFGPRGATHLKFLDPHVDGLLQAFFAEYGAAEVTGNDAKLKVKHEIFMHHVSGAEIEEGRKIVCTSLELKQLGPHNPHFEMPLF